MIPSIRTFPIGLLFAALLAAQPGEQPWRSQGILNLDRSPYARLHNVPVHAVKMGEGFWTPRMRIN
ncbi:MAG: hypothetical protein HY236_08990, partial [Acidobacteria bacterium]|nr:hypothetical protein [Acidobacteriota bacterium]